MIWNKSKIFQLHEVTVHYINDSSLFEMTNIHTLQLLAWLTFFFFLALMLDEECNPLSETDRCSWRELSVSSSIACGPSTVLFLIATTPVSIEIMWCAWKYQCIHDDIFYLDNIAFLIAPAAAISLFLLAFPFNIYKYEYYHSCFAASRRATIA